MRTSLTHDQPGPPPPRSSGPRRRVWQAHWSGASIGLVILTLFFSSLVLAQAPRPLTLEEVFGLVASYLGRGRLEEVYKYAYAAKPREGWVVHEFRLPGAEVWVEANTRRVVLYRPRGVPRHLTQPHKPLPEALALARARYGEPQRIELKPKPKEGLLVWEVRGSFGEVWLEAATLREVLRR